MEKRVGLDFNGTKFEIDLKVCNFLEKFTGLMFSRRKSAKALLFNFKNPTKIKLHSWFVFFPFVVLWLDDKNRIIEFKIVKPFRFSVAPEKTFSKIIEIPISKNYEKITKILCSSSRIRKV